MRTRLTHTLEVAQIAKSIAVALSLNETLTEAIALGHDTAHTCFGHAGESALNELCSNGYIHAEETFRRLNVIDKLNLTKEVLDEMKKHSGLSNSPNSITLEGQIIPFADKIAYLTSDFENAIDMGIITDLPERVKLNLGDTKGKIINTLVSAIIESSYDKPSIKMDETIFKEMSFFRDFACCGKSQDIAFAISYDTGAAFAL
jgi:dGTPase